MADENETPTGDEKETDAKSELGDAGKKALDAERKARRESEKLVKELQDKVKAAEDAEKTELEKLQGQVAELTKGAEAATAKAVRFEVAAAKGLSLAQARRLVGSTKEELETDADEMRTELGLKDKEETPDKPDEVTETTPVLGARPTENLRGGASNEGDAEPDPAKLAESILASRF